MEQRTILVVDDDNGLRELIRINLEHEGYGVIQAANGVQCLTSVREQRPDMVILDVMMPEMDGMECLKIIRATPESADIPVVMYSADFHYDRMQEAKRLGAQDYLVKGAVMWPESLRVVNGYVAAGADPSPAPPP